MKMQTNATNFHELLNYEDLLGSMNYRISMQILRKEIDQYNFNEISWKQKNTAFVKVWINTENQSH